MIDAWDKGIRAAQGEPERNRRLALAILGAVATPAKNIASIFGAKPEGHEPPVMFPVGRSEDRWNRGMMKDLAKEGNWKGAMDYAGRVQSTSERQNQNVENAAMGFAGAVSPGAAVARQIEQINTFFTKNFGRPATSQEISNALQARLGQVSRDQTAFRKQYPDDTYAPAAELHEIRQYLQDKTR